MEKADKCYNCKRAVDMEDGKMICNVGNKNKILYDGWQHTDNYYWCNGKYQQEI